MFWGAVAGRREILALALGKGSLGRLAVGFVGGGGEAGNVGTRSPPLQRRPARRRWNLYGRWPACVPAVGFVWAGGRWGFVWGPIQR